MELQRPVFSRIRTKSTILSLYGRIRVTENSYSRIFYAVVLQWNADYFKKASWSKCHCWVHNFASVTMKCFCGKRRPKIYHSRWINNFNLRTSIVLISFRKADPDLLQDLRWSSLWKQLITGGLYCRKLFYLDVRLLDSPLGLVISR